MTEETFVSPEAAESARAALEALNSGEAIEAPLGKPSESRADSAGENVATGADTQDHKSDDGSPNESLVIEALALAAGGEEDLHAVVEWGRANLSDEDQRAFDDALDQAIASNQLGQVEAMIANIKALMPQVQPEASGESRAPTQADLNALLAAEQKAAAAHDPQGPAVEPFADRSAMIAAINDQRYGRDPEYTARVETRIALSDFA